MVTACLSAIVRGRLALTPTRAGFGAIAAIAAMLTLASAPADAAVSGYALHPVAFLGDAAPGGGTFINDFEPSAINAAGGLAFTADVSTGGEGVFTSAGGKMQQITRSGLPGPGGVTMDYLGELGRLAFNDGGDVGVPFTLSPASSLLAVPSGVFRYSHSTDSLSAAAIPGTAMPGAGMFEGTWFNIGMNNRGDIALNGLAQGTDINPGTPPGTAGLATGVWVSHKDGTLTKIVIPGDSAPAGGIFDNAWDPSINDAGDIAFGGHVAGELCYANGPFNCDESLYLRDGATRAIRSIAHQGDPAPGGGTFSVAFGGVVNSRDDIAFIGDLTPPDPVTGLLSSLGVFQWSKGTLVSIARPGDAMPGGGHVLTAGDQVETYGENARGDVGFVVALDTSSYPSSGPDMGAYVSSHGVIRLVARTGTVIPGVGTIQYFGYSRVLSGGALPFSLTGGAVNARGQMILAATLTDGRTVLLVASPSGS